MNLATEAGNCGGGNLADQRKSKTRLGIEWKHIPGTSRTQRDFPRDREHVNGAKARQ